MNQTATGVQAKEGGIVVLTELLADLIGTAATMRLYKSSFNPVNSSTDADFSAAEANFTGYAAVPVVWGTVAIGADGDPVIVSNEGFFQATDAVTPNVIGGVYLTVQTAAGPPAVNKVVAYYPLGTPVNLTTALAFMAAAVALASNDMAGDLSVTY